MATLPQRAAAQAPAPVQVEAETIVYDASTQVIEATGGVRIRYRGIRLAADAAVVDLVRERLTAQGHVVLIDAQGRELRGEAVVYDARLQLAEVRRAETRIDQVFIHGDRLQAGPGRILAEAVSLTTCDPTRPAYRVTARQVEIIPGDRVIARGAALWVGNRRVLSLPLYTVSLRSPEETARSFPRLGYNTTDGVWIEYPYRYALGAVPGVLTLRYGTLTGASARTSLAYDRPPYAAELIVGRSQDAELRLFDQAEVAVTVAEQPGASSPLVLSGFLRGGWFSELSTGVQTSRLQYGVGVRVRPLALGPQTTWATSASWTDARYGTGGRQGVLRVDSALTHRPTPAESITLSYSVLEVLGGTPFLFDTIPVEDRVHRVTVSYGRTGDRRGAATSFTGGLVYDFRDATTSVILGYGERRPDRYHFGLAAEYNLVTTNLKLTMDSGIALGRTTYGTVQAIYNTSTATFEDLDVIIASRFCDCIDAALRYRHVRREIWFEVGLTAFPQSRLQFQVPGP